MQIFIMETGRSYFGFDNFWTWFSDLHASIRFTSGKYEIVLNQLRKISIKISLLDIIHFFYKNTLCKNTEAQITPKLRTMTRLDARTQKNFKVEK